MESINRRDFLRKSALAAGAYSGAITRLQHSPAESRLMSQKPSDELVARLSNIRSRHPSLHFDVEGLEQLRRRAKETHRHYAEMLFEWVEQNRNWSPLDMPYPSGREVALEQSAAFVTNVALAFVLSQQDEYLQLCRRWVSQMLKYPKDGVRNYGFGIYAAGLGRVYDWLYHHLTAQERQKIRTNVIEVVERLHEGSIPGASGEFWWAKAYIHHDHWIPVGGYGEAALALLGEVKQASTWAGRAKADFDFALSWLGDDGAWHEGAADWCYTMAPLLWFYSAWQSVVGENLHDIAWIRNTAKYRLYHWLGDDSYVYLNDSFRSGRYNTSGSASCHLLRRLASLFRDGHAQWLADRDEAFDMRPGPKGVYQAPYEKLSYTGQPKEYPHTQSQCVAWNVLWYDPTVKPIGPENMPRARHFENQGVVIMRTGWEKDATVVSLSCAPLAGQKCAERIRSGEQISSSNYSHAHADYNAFTLFARGQYFIVPPSYARRSSAFQNVVSVNGADFVVDPSIDVRIVALRTEKRFSYAVGDATEAFPPHLGVQRYRRHALLLDCGWMVLFDDLQLSDIARHRRNYNNFVWTVHSDPTTHQLSIAGNKAIWKAHSDDKLTLSVELLQPQDFAWEHAVLQSTGGRDPALREPREMLEALRLKRPEWYSRQMRVLSAWSWQDYPDTPTLLRHPDFLAVLWRKTSDMPAVGFSLSTNVPLGQLPPDLRDRELLLFGHDPARPDSFVSVKNGKVQRIEKQTP
ncbi:MAG: DUF4962 domain-containing protein [Sedimentisphaerales bacterium]